MSDRTKRTQKIKPWTGLIHLVLALSITAAFVTTTHTIDFNSTYSQAVHYRFQTDAFFDGRLAVADNPGQLLHDWVWTDSGAQQPWGLGVPILRMPFELIARGLGQPGFPDRLVLIFYYFLSVFLFLTMLTVGKPGSSECYLSLAERTLATVIAFFSPIMIVLLITRFDVYEEAITYLLLANLLVAGFLYHLSLKHSTIVFMAACFLIGLLVAIRPTGVFYAAISGMLLLFIVIKNKYPGHIISIGLILSLTVPAFIAITNLLRFGSAFNFGTFEPLSNATELTYALRFSYPYLEESLFNAARELFGTLFRLEHLTPSGNFSQLFYQVGLHSWQSQILRFREYYTPTYPLFVVLLVVAGWLTPIAIHIKYRRSSATRSPIVNPANVLTIWSFASFTLLFLFYLWVPAISTRYMVDFAPAISIACIISVIFILRYLSCWATTRFSIPHSNRIMGILVLLITVGWMVQTIRQGAGSAPIVYGYIHPANFAGVKAEMRPQALAGELPSVYQCGTTTDRQNIPFNLIGWNFNNAENPCLVGQSTILFFGPFECLSLLVEDFPVNQPGRSQSFSPASVRVQASASLLQRESLIRLDDNLYQLQFCRDRLTLKQRQWNSVVIGWVEPDNLAEGRAPLRLLRAAINRGSLPEQTSAGASQ